MIKTFQDRHTAAVFQGFRPKGFPPDLVRRAQKRLAQLDQAEDLGDLRLPKSNHLEAQRDDRRGRHSIRINDHWRLCFVWRDGDAYNVEIIDTEREAQ